jgi:hypothetical protein
VEGHKRLSIALAGAGLLAAIAVALVGRQATPSGGDIAAVAAEVDGMIREAAAGVQARADTLAQLPRLGWAVATDEDTVRDMTTEELAFRTRPGEHIEIANMPKGGQEVRHLLRLPPDASFAMPMSPGSRLFLHGGKCHVVAVVAVEPRQRADELTGLLAVSRVLETAAIDQRLAARGVHAELRLWEGTFPLGAPTPAARGTLAKATLTSPSASGVELSVVWPGGRPVWTTAVPVVIALLSLLGAALLWRRQMEQQHVAPADAPTTVTSPPQDIDQRPFTRKDPAAPEDVPEDLSDDVAEEDWTDPDAVKTDPVVAAVPDITQPGAPPDAAHGAIPVQVVPASGSEARRMHSGAVDLRMDPSRSGRVDISLSRSGSVSFPGQRRGGANRALTPKLGNENDPRNEEYKALFTEFMRLRRTTGEAVESLDVVDFVEALQEKRTQLIRELGVKDVRFRLAFDNGKAAIRYMTVAAAKSS